MATGVNFGKPKEDEIHAVFVEYLNLLKVPFCHIPNGGYRHKKEAAKFKRLGVISGMPDIFIMRAKKGYHGLFIELKRDKKARVSVAQKEMIELLNEEGYLAVIACSVEEAIYIVKNYFNDNCK